MQSSKTNSKQASDYILDLACPNTLEDMENPIICPNGHTFSREETIVQTDAAGKKTLLCSVENLYYPEEDFRINRVVKFINESVIELGKKYDKIKEENTTLTSWKERQKLSDDVEELRSQLQNSSKIIEELKKEKSALEQEKIALEETNQQDAVKIRLLNEGNENKVNEIQDLSKTVQNKNDTIQDLSSTIQDKEKIIIELRQQTETLKQQIEDLKKEMGQEIKSTVDQEIEDKLNNVNKKISDLEGTNLFFRTAFLIIGAAGICLLRK